jgi:hypothetical protein
MRAAARAPGFQYATILGVAECAGMSPEPPIVYDVCTG